MKLIDIMKWSDGYTDEVQTSSLAIGYANNTLAKINTKFNTNLPLITDVNADYTALSDSWFVRFMTDALSYGIKMNDGSLSEAREYKNAMDISMYEFEGADKSVVITTDEARGAGLGVTLIDTSNAVDAGWFGGGASDWTGW